MQKRNKAPRRLRCIGYISFLHIAYAGYFILDGVSMVVRHVKTVELYPAFMFVAVIMGLFGIGMSKAAFTRSTLAFERIGPELNASSVWVFLVMTVALTIVLIAFGSFYALTVPGSELIGHIVPYSEHGNLFLVRVPGSSAVFLSFTIAAASMYVFLAVCIAVIAYINFLKS
ncbi:MAG: hypothetical protein HGB37_04310 [Candidatus Moranbacteria bacterium]|nr:hypothetical protein [Candidatus Moranbacteria bacterium]